MSDPPAGRAARVNLVERLDRCQVIVCCGSGGVGKTTVSAALGIALVEERDIRVLVLTVDPARRLGTALGLPELGSEPAEIPADRLRRAGAEPLGTLLVAMLDMKTTCDRLIERYAPDRATAERILGNRFYRGLSDAFVGSHEYMAIEALHELHASGEYDCVVIDTPPTRDALDLLEAPERLADFVGGRLLSWLAAPTRFGWRAMNFAAAPFLRMADRLLGAEMLGELAAFVGDIQGLYAGVQERARQIYRLLRSPVCGFVVVTTLEPPAHAEAEYFCDRLREFGMPLRGMVVNRILPGELRGEAATRLAREVAAEPPSAVARRAAEAFMALHDAAAREGRLLERLRRLGGEPTVEIPHWAGGGRDGRGHLIDELAGLADLSRGLRGRP